VNRSLFLPTGRLRAVSLALAGAVLATVAVSSIVARVGAIPEDVALRVDGRDISIATLQRRIDVLSAIYGVTPPESGKRLSIFRRAAAKSMAVSTVIENVGRKRKIVVANKALQDELSALIEERNGDRSSFVAFLGEKGLKESDIVEELRRTRLTQRLYADVTEDTRAATKADARREYDRRRNRMRTAETRRLANIVVASQSEAAAVVQRLEEGDDFAAVASSTSLDQSTAQAGGDLGQDVPQSALEPAYGRAAFAVKEGETFGPVQTQSGWNVGQVLTVTPGKPLSFDEVEPTLVTALTARRKSTAWTAWLNKQMDAADVEYADEFRPMNLKVGANEDTKLEAP